MNDSLILIGYDDTNNYAFRTTRGFLNTEAGIAEARQYVNMLIEAKPYDRLPLAMVIPLGLMGNAPDGLTRDQAVEFGELFPLPAPLDDDEALATLRGELTGEDETVRPTGVDEALATLRAAPVYLCADASDREACVGLLHKDENRGDYVCARHADERRAAEPIPDCADNTGKGDCALPMRRDIDGKFRCSMHRSEPEPFNEGLIP